MDSFSSSDLLLSELGEMHVFTTNVDLLHTQHPLDQRDHVSGGSGETPKDAFTQKHF